MALMNSIKKIPMPMSHQYIAYLDILGYKAKIKEVGGTEKLIQAIYSSIEQAKDIIKEALSNSKVGDISLKVFSDNILICSETRWDILVAITALSQGEFLRQGIFTRGVLCYGNLGVHDDFIFGEGVILAHEIESEIAIFPRILLHESFTNAVNAYGQSVEPTNVIEFIGKGAPNFVDFDGFIVLDYINCIEGLLSHNANLMVGFYEKHMQIIVENLNKQTSDRVLQKIQWVKNYHNYCINRRKKINDVNLEKFLIR